MVSGRQARRAGGNSGPSERPCWEAVGQASGDADPTVVRRRAWASSSTGRAWAPTARSVARIVDAGRSKLQSGNIQVLSRTRSISSPPHSFIWISICAILWFYVVVPMGAGVLIAVWCLYLCCSRINSDLYYSSLLFLLFISCCYYFLISGALYSYQAF